MTRPLIPRDIALPADPDVEDTDTFERFGCSVLNMNDVIENDPTNLFNPAFVREVEIPAADLEGYMDVTVLNTPDKQERDRLFVREMSHDHLALPVNVAGGESMEVEIWGFPDPLGDGELHFPSPTMRAVEGEVVHTLFNPSFNRHTIHHHGIGHTPVNDGVGHTTFELDGDGYIYQFYAKSAGTYIYHCHVNTVLHFEMGMYGLLIIDPPAPPGSSITAPYTDGGSGFVRRAREIVPYDVEGLWVFDDFDQRWHDGPGHSDGLRCPFEPWDPEPGNANPHLHRFEPSVFCITGVIADQADPTTITHPGIARSAQPGQSVLLRIVNASYTKLRVSFPAALNAEVIAMDGKVLGGESEKSYSHPFPLSDLGHVFDLTTAQRWDVLIQGAPTGTWPVEAEYRHWITGQVLGRASTVLTVG
jgi:FtsP/CotA-like multicopper oxidase with cupredoxin domain